MLTVDANVWVAALDEDDAMHAPSVLFLEAGALELGARLRLRGAVSTRPAPRRRELPRRGFAD